jgi:serine/threonine protein phosphatase PrpC
MLFEYRAFWLPKDVQNAQAYEDAFDADAVRGLAAICDGVSSTIFAGRWAAILARSVVADPPDVHDAGTLEAWLKRTRDAWSQAIDESTLAWHQKPKMLEGAGTTLLWIELAQLDTVGGVSRPYQLRAYSVGDCCLFHLRNGGLLQSFPIQDSARFEDNPQVIRSVAKRGERAAFEAMETQCNPGDLIVLATDAVASWTMRQLEAGTAIDWEAYWNAPLEQWQQWLIGLRQQNQIRYDDSTAVLLRVAGGFPGIQPVDKPSEDSLLDAAEDRLREAGKWLKGSLRKGLRDLAESKWLNESGKK